MSVNNNNKNNKGSVSNTIPLMMNSDLAFAAAMTPLIQFAPSPTTPFLHNNDPTYSGESFASSMDNFIVGSDGRVDLDFASEFDALFGDLPLFPNQPLETVEMSSDLLPCADALGDWVTQPQSKVSISVEDFAWLITKATENIAVNPLTLDIAQPIQTELLDDIFVASPSASPSPPPPSPSSANETLEKQQQQLQRSIPRKRYKIHKCPHDGCGKEFDRAFNLKTHQKIHDKNRARDHFCNYCGMGFFGIHALSRHAASHDQTRKQHCGTCDRGFSRIDALRRHEKICF
ncbi:hypothetical protein BDR26DRAFT_857857 [Obelidium mucronatum]|nr:hypothetical protein BDR26DRAFT_857857 [Obelidium mucronatum]